MEIKNQTMETFEGSAQETETRKPKRELTEAAQCAKLIRKDLKKAFPTTKFRVVSSNYSMGDSVNVYWTDGPTGAEVEKITVEYKDGSFNGMDDSYSYRANPDESPRAKYVFANRDMSEEAKQSVITKYNSTWVNGSKIESFDSYNEGRQMWNTTVVYQEFAKTNFAEGTK